MWFLIWFFLKNAIRSKRVIWLSLLGLVPVLVAAFLILFPVFSTGRNTVSTLCLEMGLTLHIHILLPLVALLIGSGTIAEETDEGTLPYIMTRPIPKWKFAVSKIAAGCMAAALILLLSLFTTYCAMKGAAGFGAWLIGLPSLFQAAGVLVLGILAYIGLFSLLGALIKRAVLTGLVFAFGWEKIIAHLPSRMQHFTVVAYLNDLYPNYREPGSGGDIAELMKRILQSGGASTVSPGLTLILIFAACTAATAMLLYFREYCVERQ
jgi:ABC-2 type transport system permease protein